MKHSYGCVAIVILNYNGKNLLQKFLPSVVKFTPSEFNIFIIDNASTDDSIDFLNKTYPHIQIVQNNKNEGFAEGYNQGLKKIPADFYILINSDIEVTEGWVFPLLDFLIQNERVGVVQPKILSYNNKNEFEYAGASGGFVDRFFYPFCRGRIIYSQEIDQGQYDDPVSVFWASGAAFCVRANLFHQIDGFDSHFFAHQEEIDFCWRLQRLGYFSYVIPSVTVYHLGGGTLEYNNLQKVYLNHRNGLMMVYKNLPLFKALKIIIARICIEQICEGFNHCLKGNFAYSKTLLKAHSDFIFWMFKKYPSSQKQLPYLPTSELQGFFNCFIIIEYFIRKNKLFSLLKK